jgi:hypothetical protein
MIENLQILQMRLSKGIFDRSNEKKYIKQIKIHTQTRARPVGTFSSSINLNMCSTLLEHDD